MKTFVKAKVNPVYMKIEIVTLQSLGNGRLLIETHNKQEIDALSKTINEMCGRELEASMPRCRNPRLIICNVPDGLNVGNAKELIMKQNSQLCVEQEDITARCPLRTREGPNI